ncbi:MAG: hypothetical protein H6Q68_850 [Firmicutes bacterium]|nr:hypothetical protein [Bacillota bacterium]
MLKNLFQEKTAQGKKTVGMFFEMGNANVAEAIAFTNLDYFIVDAEHGPFDVESTMNMFRAAELHDSTAFVRVKDSSRTSILKMLDIGAKGLIIPQVQSLEEIKRIVEYGKYYPLGQRGVAYARGAGWGYAEHARGKSINEYFDTCNKHVLLIPQCETVGCLNQIEEIANTDGIDGIFVGPYDLSVSMGIPTQFEKPEFKVALERIKKAVKDAGKFCIIYAANAEIARQRLNEGFDSTTVGEDIGCYIKSINALVDQVKK